GEAPQLRRVNERLGHERPPHSPVGFVPPVVVAFELQPVGPLDRPRTLYGCGRRFQRNRRRGPRLPAATAETGRSPHSPTCRQISSFSSRTYNLPSASAGWAHVLPHTFAFASSL